MGPCLLPHTMLYADNTVLTSQTFWIKVVSQINVLAIPQVSYLWSLCLGLYHHSFQGAQSPCSQLELAVSSSSSAYFFGSFLLLLLFSNSSVSFPPKTAVCFVNLWVFPLQPSVFLILRPSPPWVFFPDILNKWISEKLNHFSIFTDRNRINLSSFWNMKCDTYFFCFYLKVGAVINSYYKMFNIVSLLLLP